MEVKKMLNYKEVPNKDGRLNNQNLTKTTVERFKKKRRRKKEKRKKDKPTRTKRMGEETTATKPWNQESRWMSGN